MNRLIPCFVVTCLCFCSISSYAQYSEPQDTLQLNIEKNLELKLDYQPIQLGISSANINNTNRPIYIFNQVGMYEQYHLVAANSTMLSSYKAYFPSGPLYYTGNNRRRDSFNPHGANDIGSALLNGFINGVLLGNKY